MPSLDSIVIEIAIVKHRTRVVPEGNGEPLRHVLLFTKLFIKLMRVDFALCIDSLPRASPHSCHTERETGANAASPFSLLYLWKLVRIYITPSPSSSFILRRGECSSSRGRVRSTPGGTSISTDSNPLIWQPISSQSLQPRATQRASSDRDINPVSTSNSKSCIVTITRRFSGAFCQRPPLRCREHAVLRSSFCGRRDLRTRSAKQQALSC